MSDLCYPTYHALKAIAELCLPVVEIGAGDGEWARALRIFGVQVYAYDKSARRNPHVSRGHHTTAAALHQGAMLAVWPPDGADVADWISARQWEAVIIIADHERIDPMASLKPYRKHLGMPLPEGSKGFSNMIIYLPKLPVPSLPATPIFGQLHATTTGDSPHDD